MKKLTNTAGFTLLEIIIVIIIVGVLASLALPRFFSTVEFSRSAEALSALSVIRGSMERCYLQNGGSYANCNVFTNLDIQDPATSPNAQFDYSWPAPAPSATGYSIRGTRNTYEGGSATSTITITQTSTTLSRAGATAFSNIK